MTQVDLHHLTKQYSQNTPAVADLNLTIPAGKITALLGPSGCGKTTTLKMIAGLLSPSQGDILFNGVSVLSIPAEKRQAVMSFQNHLLFPTLNVADNVGFGLKMRGERPELIQKRVAEMLELVQLAGYEKRRPEQLSGGQQQRVALARALIIQPRLLLLDEPLSNLDAHLREEMRELIVRLQQQFHITTIFVTHDQEEAVILADQIALLFHGRLQQYAEPSAFYNRPASAAVARFFGGVNFLPGRVVDNSFVIHNLSTPFFLAEKPEPGPAVLTIRPEHIQLAQGQTHNLTSGIVISRLYAGSYTQLVVRIAESMQLAVMVLGDNPLYPAGASISLFLPPEKCWVLPSTS